MKRTYGGIFVILAFCLAVFYCFEGMIFRYEQTVGGIISIWIYFFTTIFIYGFFKSTAKSGDFTLIAGYDPKKNYNKAELADMIRFFTLCSSFFGCFYIGLHLLTPFVRKNEGELFAGILTAAYVLSLALSVFVLNSKYKSRIIQVDDNTNDLEK